TRKAARPRKPASDRATELVPPVAPVGAHVRASPLARRRAAERGIELAGVAGSGPGGAVVAADLDRASRISAPAAPAAPAPAVPGGAPGRAPPRARRRAAGRGIGLPGAAASGPGGAAVAADLARAPRISAPAAPAAPAPAVPAGEAAPAAAVPTPTEAAPVAT